MKTQMKKIADYIKKTFKELIGSFKSLDRKGYLLVVAYSLAFVVLAYLSTVLFNKKFINFIERSMVYFPTITNQIAGADVSAQASAIIVKIFIIIFTYLFITTVIYGVFNALVWRQISGKKFTKKFFWKFIAMDFVWTVLWMFFIFLLAGSIRAEVLPWWIVIFFIIFIHLSTVMRISFTKHTRIWKPMADAFKTGIGKIKHFVVPYIYAGVLIALLQVILNLIGMIGINFSYFLWIVVIVNVFMLAWVKYYIYSFAKKLV